MNEKPVPVAVLNGDQVYLDELIRENARLTVLREADRMRIMELEEALVDTTPLSAQQVEEYEARIAAAQGELAAAVADLHTVMKGGDPCAVCKRKCKMGEECDPVWRRQK